MELRPLGLELKRGQHLMPLRVTISRRRVLLIWNLTIVSSAWIIMTMATSPTPTPATPSSPLTRRGRIVSRDGKGQQ